MTAKYSSFIRLPDQTDFEIARDVFEKLGTHRGSSEQSQVKLVTVPRRSILRNQCVFGGIPFLRSTSLF